MGNDQIDRFYARLAEDEDLQKAYFDAMDRVAVEAVAGFAADNGFGFSADQLAEAWTAASAELSDEELEGVAGGTGRSVIASRGRAMTMMFKFSQNAIANLGSFDRSPGQLPGMR